MAVRHGYGKAAGTDALVFAYDTGDTRNSYRGEPTTNLATDTPSQSGWQGTYSVVDSNTKTFLITTQQNDASVGAAWRTWYWSVSSYIGSYITISADVEFVSETNCTFSNITVGQGNTGTYPTHILGSDAADRQTISTKPVEKIHMTWSGVINATGIVGFTFWTSNVTVNGATAVLRISNVQIEAKAHETPFVNGTRSSTQGLLDLTGNSSIDLSNVSFDSNADIDLDGTNDYIETADSSLLDLTTDMSFEFVVNADSSQGNLYPRLIDKGSAYLIHINQEAPFGVYHNIYTSAGLRQTGTTSSIIEPNTWNHIVVTYDSQIGKIYINGELVRERDYGSPLACSTNSTSVRIGGDGSTNRPLNGKLPVSKIYNRALTAAEVLNNFNNYKSRFNL